MRRVPSKDVTQPPLPSHTVRRDLELRIREGSQREGSEGRSAKRWRRMDLGCPGRGQQARRVVDGRAARLANKVQLTTDGHNAYLNAVEDAFGLDVDFAQLQKIYGSERTDSSRYGPGHHIASRKVVVRGDPDPAHVSTSYVERQNLTMRMQMRRFTRLTNGFSKHGAHHADMVALLFIA